MVSIRAPARGATSRPANRIPQHVVSIRAPARGATYSPTVRSMTPQFQSAPPHGGRRWYRRVGRTR